MNAKLLQRMPEELHERIKKLADHYGLSVNALINMACEDFAKTGKLDEMEARIEQLEHDVAEIKNKGNG